MGRNFGRFYKDGMNFYGDADGFVRVDDVAVLGNGGRPIQDKTGLTGNYDYHLEVGGIMRGPQQGDQQNRAGCRRDPGGSMTSIRY